MDDHFKYHDSALDLDLDGPAVLDNMGKPRTRRSRSGRWGEGKVPVSRKRSYVPRGGGFFDGFFNGLIWALIGFGIAILATLFGIYAYFSPDLPSTARLKNYAPPTVTYFYADDGRVIGEYYHERRFVLPLSEIPQVIRKAYMAVEDAAFYEHQGVNPKGLLRAFLMALKEGQATQGASTITMQVARAFLLTPEKKLTRKLKEIILAFRIEGNFSKEHILYLYLNQIYLGEGAYGVEAAARTYFGKSVISLTLAEAAILAGITQAPSHNPITDPEQARNRQKHALDRMLKLGYISVAEYEAAVNEPWRIKPSWPNPNTVVAPYFAEHVRRLLEEKFGADSLYNNGWRVYTTVNIEDQKAADRAVAQGLWEYARRRGYRGPEKHFETDKQIAAFLTAEGRVKGKLAPGRLYRAVIMKVDDQSGVLTVRVGTGTGKISLKNLTWALKGAGVARVFRRGDVVWVRLDDEIASPGSQSQVLALTLERQTDLQAALLSIRADTGDVKAMVGGRDFNESQFNRAIQSQRQPGSSFKPILYTAAMENGYTPDSILNDAPFVVDDVGSQRRWKPVNSDLKFKGPMTLYTALVGSRNLISIKLLDRIGFEPVFKTAAAMGITEKLPRSLTIALGAYGLHMPELVTAYSTFPNMGIRVTPRYFTRIEDRYGNVVETVESERILAIDPGAACAVTWMLRGVVDHGTATVVKPLARPVGGKTGTTNDFSDAWFVGFTPELVTAVWLGTDQQRPRAVGEVGGRAAGPIFLYYMREVLKDVPITDFKVPPEAEIQPNGSFGVCYKVGTIGTGISETQVIDDPEDAILRNDFEDSDDNGIPAVATVLDSEETYLRRYEKLPEAEMLGEGGD